MLLVVNVVFCDENEDKTKVKRGASIDSFSRTMTKHIAGHLKSSSHLNNFEVPSHQLSLDIVHGPSKSVVGRTTVEFWPPDMDKKKFFSAKQELTDFWPRMMREELRQNYQQVQELQPVKLQHPEPEPKLEPVELLQPEEMQQEVKVSEPKPVTSFPDIPIPEHTSYRYNPIVVDDFEALLGPSEGTIIDDDAITNAGPVVFPTSDPTTRDPERTIAYISRGNANKKRKLKKKVKPTPVVPLAEITETTAPYSNSVIETASDNNDRNVPIEIPIYEPADIDREPFNPSYYPEVISNLSNLTELSFGFQSKKEPKKNVVILKETSADNDFNSMEGEIIEMNKIAPIVSPTILPMSIDDLMPLEKFFNDLKKAIDERDVEQIKRIVRVMDKASRSSSSSSKPSSGRKSNRISARRSKTSEAVAVISTTDATSKTTTAPATTRKVYIAPRLRKQKVVKVAKPVDEIKKKDEVIEITTTEADAPTTTSFESITTQQPSSSSSKLSSTVESKTESETTTAAAESTTLVTKASESAEPLIMTTTTVSRPTRSRRRSHLAPRIKGHLAVRSRQTAKNNVKRRIGRRPYN